MVIVIRDQLLVSAAVSGLFCSEDSRKGWSAARRGGRQRGILQELYYEQRLNEKSGLDLKILSIADLLCLFFKKHVLLAL